KSNNETDYSARAGGAGPSRRPHRRHGAGCMRSSATATEQMKIPEGYQPMASAPRDRSFVIVKLVDRPSHRRKYWEHIVRWHGFGVNPHWRSFMVDGTVIKDGDCVGWRPMDDEAWRVVQERRDRAREAQGCRNRAKAGRRSTAT